MATPNVLLGKLGERHYQEVVEVFTMLNNLRRWTDLTTQQKYNELSKQGFNCVTAYLIAKCCEEEGWEIDYSKFPRIALGRAFAKVYVYFDTPEHKINEICNISQIAKSQFDEVATQIIAEKTDESFADFLKENPKSDEVKIYKAATKIATYIEWQEQGHRISERKRHRQIKKDLKKYLDVPGVKYFSRKTSNGFKLLKQISGLRNQARWATHSYTTECSVLGHLFDTGVFAYLNALDEGYKEDFATEMFFFGVFHDIAEVWTKDIPSPIKDRMAGLRKATEEYERSMIDKNIYKKLPTFLAEAVRSVMMEDPKNAKYKDRLKNADYLSADSECYRNYVSGTRDKYFAEALKTRNMSKETSTNAIQLHKWFIKKADKLNLL